MVRAIYCLMRIYATMNSLRASPGSSTSPAHTPLPPLTTEIPGRSDAQKLLTPGEVARWLGVSAAWVRDHATGKEPHSPAVKLGKLLRFRPIDVETFRREWCQ